MALATRLDRPRRVSTIPSLEMTQLSAWPRAPSGTAPSSFWPRKRPRAVMVTCWAVASPDRAEDGAPVHDGLSVASDPRGDELHKVLVPAAEDTAGDLDLLGIPEGLQALHGEA